MTQEHCKTSCNVENAITKCYEKINLFKIRKNLSMQIRKDSKKKLLQKA